MSSGILRILKQVQSRCNNAETKNSDISLTVYPLMHDWCQERILEGVPQLGCRRAMSLLTRSVAWRSESEDYTFRRSLAPHVHTCLQVYECTEAGQRAEHCR
jgi:hypothetical protein